MALFTRNCFPGAPVIVGRELVRKGRLRAIVVNSKVSNVGTGEQGILNARRMGIAASAELGVPADEVLMGSGGGYVPAGDIDQVRFYDRALSAAEIMVDMQQ